MLEIFFISSSIVVVTYISLNIVKRGSVQSRFHSAKYNILRLLLSFYTFKVNFLVFVNIYRQLEGFLLLHCIFTPIIGSGSYPERNCCSNCPNKD